jgi:hypothetical protein
MPQKAALDFALGIIGELAAARLQKTRDLAIGLALSRFLHGIEKTAKPAALGRNLEPDGILRESVVALGEDERDVSHGLLPCKVERSRAFPIFFLLLVAI